MKDIHKSHNLTTHEQILHDKTQCFSDRRLALTPLYYHSISYINSGINRGLLMLLLMLLLILLMLLLMLLLRGLFMLLWLEPSYYKKVT